MYRAAILAILVGIAFVFLHVVASHKANAAVYWSDTFDRSADTFADSFFSPWSWEDIAYRDRLTTDSTYYRDGGHSAKFDVYDSDVYPRTGDSKPRAQLGYRTKHLCEGEENWLGWSVLFPTDFPRDIPSGGWMMIAEHGFGPPYGQPPSTWTVRDGTDTQLVFSDEQDDANKSLWAAPITYGRWMDIVMHVHWSKSSSKGWVELWLNGERQTFENGARRQYMNTLRRDATGCGEIMLQNYREPGMFDRLTIWQDEMKLGESYESVASRGRSYSRGQVP